MGFSVLGRAPESAPQHVRGLMPESEGVKGVEPQAKS